MQTVFVIQFIESNVEVLGVWEAIKSDVITYLTLPVVAINNNKVKCVFFSIFYRDILRLYFFSVCKLMWRDVLSLL